MKKLFLYLSIIILGTVIFFTAFYLSKKFFKENCYKVVIEETEEKPEYVYEQDDLFVESIVHNAEQKAHILADNYKYGLSIVNGYIVVYDCLSNQVFEYTDIDADIIKKLDLKLYNELENRKFTTKEELFDFLESIDS